MIKETIYKIYNRKLNKYAAAGILDYYHIKGKVWNNLKNLKLHLREISKFKDYSARLKSYTEDCELVTYEIVEVDRRSMNQIMNWFREDLNMKEVEEARLQFERDKKERLKKYLELKQEFE